VSTDLTEGKLEGKRGITSSRSHYNVHLASKTTPRTQRRIEEYNERLVNAVACPDSC